jgi:formamidopyrimidine-DNA glycosylase
MPELPEVETVRLGLNSVIATSKTPTVVGGEVLLSSTIAGCSQEFFLSSLYGQSLVAWHRRGKYLLCELSNGGWLGVHLRMTGRLLWKDRQCQDLSPHTRVRLFLDGDRELRFDDQRTFGKMWYVPPQVPVAEVISGLKSMGAEPLSAEFTSEYLQQKLHSKQRAIKTALLDQTVVAGIGNIYADEALFIGRIHPTTLASRLNSAQVDHLRLAIVSVISEGLKFGGTTFSNFQDINGKVGNYLDQAWVFRQHGQPCQICQTPIQRIKLGGRSTHFCPNCQPRQEN